MRGPKRATEPADLMKIAAEVAAVKAQAQAIILRVRDALDELSETMESLPGGEVADAGPTEDT